MTQINVSKIIPVNTEVNEVMALLFQYPKGFLNDCVDAMVNDPNFSWPITITMPCGSTMTINSKDEIPLDDVHCPCGSEEHWFVKHKITED